MPGPVRSQFERTAPSPFPVVVQPGEAAAVFSTSDRHQHVVIRTGAFDLVEASPDKRSRFVSLFDDLLSSVDVRLQIHVASRLSSGDACADPRLARYLGDRALSSPSYQRTVHIILSDTPPQIERLTARWRRVRRVVETTTPDGAIAKALLRHADRALNQRRARGLHPGLLEGMELHRFLDQHVPHPLTRPDVAYDWSESPDDLELDGVLHRTYFLNGYPGAELLPGWLGPLLDLPAEFDLSVHAFKVTPASAMRMLNTRIRDLQATRMSDAATGAVGDPLAEAGLPEAIGLRREIAANQQHAFSVAVYLGLWAGTRAELQAIGSRAEDAGARCMARLLPAKFQMAPARLCTSPVGVDPVAADRLLPSGVLRTLCPWVWDEIQQPQGRLFGFNLRGGSPVLVDTLDEDRFSNANLGIFGHSGAGKTYLMKSLLLADAAEGIGAFIIDPEDEYREVCRRAGGEWLDLALGSANSINVLEPALGSVGERDPLGDQVLDLLDLVGTMCGTLGDEDRVAVDEALQTVLGRGEGTLADVRACLEQRSRAPRVVKALRRWTEGPIGALFSRPTNVKVDADFVAFGLRDLKEEMLPVRYFLLAH